MLVKRLTKKLGGAADDMMLGLEEGDEARSVDLAEADEGVHLVDVAAHCLGEVLQRGGPAGRR